MSKLGKTPILLPKGVEVKGDEKEVHVKGARGTLSRSWIPGIKLKIESGRVLVELDERKKIPKSFYGLYWALLNNMIVGVSRGFEERLSMVGVGYRAALDGGKKLSLQVGTSHPVHVIIPPSIEVTVDKNVMIIIKGNDKQIVGQFAATVRAIKPPEPYKGKGIRYEHEHVRKKAGKAAKAKTAAG